MCEEEVDLPMKWNNGADYFDDLYTTSTQMMDTVDPSLSCELAHFTACSRVISHIQYVHTGIQHVTVM